MSVAKLLEKRIHQVPGKASVSEYFFEVPLDHDAASSKGTARLFARSIARYQKPVDPTKAETEQLPWLLYLQGGPGMGCKSPENYGWTERVLDKGYQILFLDQRGTGLSETLTPRTLSFAPPQQIADHVKLFRADSIIKDCEAIRKTLTADYPEEKKKWSIIGQSFGGFCCMTYLSFQ
ncbi:MAG: hypothetical protein LQ346_003369 [Caloplaca aetnensis]|nr:MAG: hypothetical protein LQ346_003369 [Caloplaca aetnensis]